MSLLNPIQRLAGSWRGTNRLWLSPESPAFESPATAVIGPAGGGKFVRLDYTWQYEGKSQEGSILYGGNSQRQRIEAVWIDSWHMGEGMMMCQGNSEADGTVVVRGLYAAPTGPDWGWSTSVIPVDVQTFRLRMDNIQPDGTAMRAVEVLFTRM